MSDKTRPKGLSRRDLFSMLRRPITAAVKPQPAPAPASSTGPALPAPLRPPGAAPELMIADTCIRCGACVEICPRQAIRPLPGAYGGWADTPYIVPRQAPCVLCNGLLCTTVCPSGALRPLAAVTDVQMGAAEVDPRTCLPFQDAACGECHRRCPVPGALALDDKGRPAVTTACTGCGLCEHYCPTEQPSIRVRPREAHLW